MNKVQWLRACLLFEKDTHKNACSWTRHHHLCKFLVCSIQCLERHHERHFGNMERPRNFRNAKYVYEGKVIFEQQVVESFSYRSMCHGFVMSTRMRWPRTKGGILVIVIQSYVDNSYWGHNLHHKIIQIHNNFLWDWHYSAKYFSCSIWIWRIFLKIILSVPQKKLFWIWIMLWQDSTCTCSAISCT